MQAPVNAVATRALTGLTTATSKIIKTRGALSLVVALSAEAAEAETTKIIVTRMNANFFMADLLFC
jgi:hypothetical protein